ncbi:MAG: hypothetical protein J2P58_09910 [Acidimicrobiaceae bacterium]|nr:hypothetical protein [Acidimicrobiaceae bacterium]
MSEPYEDWQATGDLQSDTYVGVVNTGDGAKIAYALFGVDPDQDDDAIEESIESLPGDLEAKGCECKYVRAAVIRSDEGSVEVAKDHWHSDGTCPANVRQEHRG